MCKEPVHEVDSETEDLGAVGEVGAVLGHIGVLAHVQHPLRHLLPHVRLHLHLHKLEVVRVDGAVALLIPQKVLKNPIVLQQDLVTVRLHRGMVEAVRLWLLLLQDRLLEFPLVDHLGAEEVADGGGEELWRGVLAVRVVGDMPGLVNCWQPLHELRGDGQRLGGEEDSVSHRRNSQPSAATQLCKAC